MEVVKGTRRGVLRKTWWICTIGRENLASEDLQELTHFLDVIEAVWQTFVYELGCSDSNEVIDYLNTMPDCMLATTMIATQLHLVDRAILHAKRGYDSLVVLQDASPTRTSTGEHVNSLAAVPPGTHQNTGRTCK